VQWRGATGQDAHSQAIPSGAWSLLFADLAHWQLQLVSGSAARNAGTSSVNGRTAPPTDREGAVRPAPRDASAYDIGAYEFTPAPVCPADFNGVGGVSVQDVFDFLAAYFAALPGADFNGVGGVSVQDVFDFLAAYFSGCP
jgi:hypothetical protein